MKHLSLSLSLSLSLALLAGFVSALGFAPLKLWPLTLLALAGLL